MTTGVNSAATSFDHHDTTLSAEQVRWRSAELREGCPVAHSDQHGGFEVISRYGDVRRVLTDHATFSSADGVQIPITDLPPVPAMDFDDPMHAQWRSVLSPPLTPRAVRALEPSIRDVADILIDEFAGVGSADLVPDFAEPLPAIVIGRMIGLDHAEAVEGRRIAINLFASNGNPAAQADALVRFQEFTARHLDERRREPRDDYLTQISRGVVEGMELDDQGVVGILIAYIVGGHHSTGSGLAGLIRDVLTIPDVKQAVVERPRELPRIIEESLRLTTPLQFFARTATCPVSLHGRDIHEGDRVLVDLAAANRDPRQYDDPDDFDANRPHNRHVAFGVGRHVCQGQHLARTELRVALTRLLERLPDIRLDGEPVQSGLIGGVLMGHQSLPATFTPQSPHRT